MLFAHFRVLWPHCAKNLASCNRKFRDLRLGPAGAQQNLSNPHRGGPPHLSCCKNVSLTQACKHVFHRGPERSGQRGLGQTLLLPMWERCQNPAPSPGYFLDGLLLIYPYNSRVGQMQLQRLNCGLEQFVWSLLLYPLFTLPSQCL